MLLTNRKVMEDPITLLGRQFAYAQEPIAGVHALCVFLSPLSVDRQLVEQPVCLDPVFYGKRALRIGNRQALCSKRKPTFVEALVAAEPSGSEQNLGARRACRGCLHVGGDNFIGGTPEFLFLPSRMKELRKASDSCGGDATVSHC